MPGLTFQQLQQLGAKPKTGFSLDELGQMGAKSIQLQAPSFGKRIEEDLAKRRQTVQAGFEAQSLGKQTLPESVLQTVGQGAGFLWDIGGEAIVSALQYIPGIIKEPIKGAFKDITSITTPALLNNPITLAGLNAINNGIDSYQEWKQGNPVAARNLESVINIGMLFPIEKVLGIAGKEAITTAGVTAGKGAGILEEKLTKQFSKEAIEIIKPELTKIEKQQALEAGRGILKGKALPRILETVTIKPTIRELKMAEAVSGVVKKSANPVENINAILNEIKRVAISTQEAVEFKNIIFNERQLRSALNIAKQESRIVFGTDKVLQNSYNSVVNEMIRQARKEPKNLGGLFQARKNFDKIIEYKFPKLLSNPIGDSVKKNAVMDVRRTVNKYIAEKLPEGNAYKQSLLRQNLMYDAVRNISKKTAGLVDFSPIKKLIRFVRQNPLTAVATGGIVTFGAMTGLLSNPVIIATLLLGGSVKVGKAIITSKILKQFLITVLKQIEKSGSKVGQPEALNAIRTLIRKLPDMPVGLSIREVQKFGKISKELKPLAQEAKKYKSAEEFKREVRSDKVFYRGGAGKLDLTKSIFISRNADLALSYSPAYPDVVRAEKDLHAFIRKPGKTLDIYNTEDAKKFLNEKILDKPIKDDFVGVREVVFSNWEKIINQAEKEGYDYIRHLGEGQFKGVVDEELVVLNPQKSLISLTDFYNQVVKEIKVKKYNELK